MSTKNFEEFNKELSWSTRIYTLATVVIAFGAFLFNAWDTDFAFTIIVAIAVILFIETFAIYFHKHPKFWRSFRIVILLLFLALLLIGFKGH